MTNEQMAGAFNEWMRRYTDKPDEFLREWQTVQQYLAEKSDGREPSYGETSAVYFNTLLAELSGST